MPTVQGLVLGHSPMIRLGHRPFSLLEMDNVFVVLVAGPLDDCLIGAVVCVTGPWKTLYGGTRHKVDVLQADQCEIIQRSVVSLTSCIRPYSRPWFLHTGRLVSMSSRATIFHGHSIRSKWIVDADLLQCPYYYPHQDALKAAISLEPLIRAYFAAAGVKASLLRPLARLYRPPTTIKYSDFFTHRRSCSFMDQLGRLPDPPRLHRSVGAWTGGAMLVKVALVNGDYIGREHFSGKSFKVFYSSHDPCNQWILARQWHILERDNIFIDEYASLRRDDWMGHLPMTHTVLRWSSLTLDTIEAGVISVREIHGLPSKGPCAIIDNAAHFSIQIAETSPQWTGTILLNCARCIGMDAYKRLFLLERHLPANAVVDLFDVLIDDSRIKFGEFGRHTIRGHGILREIPDQMGLVSKFSFRISKVLHLSVLPYCPQCNQRVAFTACPYHPLEVVSFKASMLCTTTEGLTLQFADALPVLHRKNERIQFEDAIWAGKHTSINYDAASVVDMQSSWSAITVVVDNTHCVLAINSNL